MPRPIAWGKIVAMVAILALFITLGWRGREPTGIEGGDDVTYLALSHSLESGSYREIYSTSAPLHRKFPPGYPAWLVLVRHALGEQPDRIRMANLALVGLALCLTFLTARKLAGEGFAFATVFLLAMNDTQLGSGGTMLSEALFLALLSATLALIICGPPGATWPVYLAIGTALAAFLTRTAGIALVLGVGCWLLTRERRSGLWVYALTTLVIVGGWFWYAGGGGGDALGSSYTQDFALGKAQSGGSNLGVAAGHVGRNSVFYATEGMPYALGVPTIAGTLVDNVSWVLVIFASLAAGLVNLWRRSRPAVMVFILYFGVLLLWPWAVYRLLAPIVPLMTIVMLLGVRHLAQRWIPRAAAPLWGVMVALLSVGAIRVALLRDARGQACDWADPYHSPGCYSPEMRGFVTAVEYVRDRTAPQEALLTSRPAAAYYLGGRLAEAPGNIRWDPPAGLAESMRTLGVRYVIATKGDRVDGRAFTELLLPACQGLRVEERFAGTTLVLTAEPPSSPGQDACPMLRGWAQRDVE